ncbi:MAG TPA: hypothetical protein VK582_16415 [Pyrinomonadaceae bacterium]|nr:hypothetical protein [Pyrinomonadaceae bacterium]
MLASATVNPAGSVSLNPTPVSVLAELGLVIVNVSGVVPLSGMVGVGAPNCLLIVGGAKTVMLALEVLPKPPSLELT